VNSKLFQRLAGAGGAQESKNEADTKMFLLVFVAPPDA